MSRVTVAVLLLVLFTLAKNPTPAATATAIQDSGQQSPPASPQGGAQVYPESLDTLRRQGMKAYRAGDYAGALRSFRQVTALDPSDVVAYNVAANCSVRLGDYPSAIDSFQQALKLLPDEYHNLSGLMRAYTLAGKTTERDELRKHIAELEKQGKLPPVILKSHEKKDFG